MSADTLRERIAEAMWDASERIRAEPYGAPMIPWEIAGPKDREKWSAIAGVALALFREHQSAGIERAAREINNAIAQHGRIAAAPGLVEGIIRRNLEVGE